ncbi:hypothetical protein M0R01_03270 [bacterium]|nr:hypothetical protein [bacterium]
MDYKQPSLLVTVFFLILGAGIFYFLDKPLVDNSDKLDKMITELSRQKRLQEEHAMKIGEIGLSINASNWPEKKKKMEINFTSSPFYVPKMEKFFRDIIMQSGMTIGNLSIQLGSVGPQATTTSSAKNPSEQPQAVNPAQSSVSGVKGPVRRNSFSISTNGTYEQLKELLAIFEKQACLISVKKIDFGEQSEGKFTFNITGEVYSY